MNDDGVAGAGRWIGRSRERAGRRVARRTGVLMVLAALLGSVALAVRGCGWGCGAELRVEPVVVHGNGQGRVDVELAARITNNGRPVESVDIEFFGIGPNGVILGRATSGPDGVALLHAREALGPDSINGQDAAAWTAYRARVSYLQGGDKTAAQTICAGSADAPFRYEP